MEATWSEDRRLVDLAAVLQKYLPRGRGAIPRLLGGLLGARRYMVTRHGSKLVLARNSMDVYATMRLNGNAWDYTDFQICMDSLPDGSVFYDIGANVGYFSIEAAKIAPVRVVAFEAQADLSEAIRQSARLSNVDVIVVDALVGDHDGDATLYLAPASIHASAVDDSGRGATTSISCPMITVDHLVETGEIPPPDFVKMDVEGSEHLVFAGAVQTIHQHRPNIFLEYLPNEDPGGRVRAAVMALQGYDIYVMPNTTRGPKETAKFFKPATEEDWQTCDSIFLRNPARPLRRDIFTA